MDGPYQERWQELCRQIQIENDYVRFQRLLEELNEELLKKEKRLQHRVERTGSD